jgi:hypothetical protein
MSDDAILTAMFAAIQRARIDDPGRSDGTEWDQSILSNEESLHLARAALKGIRAANFEVVSKKI